MTPVKDKLSGRQYVLRGKDSNGKDASIYLSNEVGRKLHINVGGKELFVETDRMIDVIARLKFGDAYQASLDRIKEAKHAKQTWICNSCGREILLEDYPLLEANGRKVCPRCDSEQIEEIQEDEEDGEEIQPGAISE